MKKSKKILIVTPYVPWPPSEGGRISQFRTLEALRGACEFTLVIPIHKEEEENHAKELALRLPHVRVLPVRCYYKAPPPGPRQRIKRILAIGLRPLLPSPKKKSEAVASLEPALFFPFTPLPKAFLETLDREISNGHDIFQAEFVEMLSLGPWVRERLPSVFIHHQIHAVYAKRFLESAHRQNPNSAYLAKRMEAEEKAFLPFFHQVVVFSEVDRRELLAICPELPVVSSPFPCPEEPLAELPRVQTPAPRFVFVASEIHTPNTEGLIWFMREVWPKLKKSKPSATLEVIGRWSEFGQKSVPDSEQIQFSGFVENLTLALQGKIMIVPLWVGSGIRTKILGAWGAGCPVVTTSVGVEGLPGASGEHFLTADTAEDFARACQLLASDVNTYRRIAAAGHGLMQNEYSLASVRSRRLEIYEKLLEDKTGACKH